MDRFRLSNGQGQTFEFSAAQGGLNNGLNQAYLMFSSRHGPLSVVLEVFHCLHGWQPVFSETGHCTIIKNPLLLDYVRLHRAVTHTLAEVSQWPSEQERQQEKQQRRVQERALQAHVRRSRFRIIKSVLTDAGDTE